MISANEYIQSLSQNIKTLAEKKRKLAKILKIIPDLEVLPETRKWNSHIEFTTKNSGIMKKFYVSSCSCCENADYSLKFFIEIDKIQIFYHKSFFIGNNFYGKFEVNSELLKELTNENLPTSLIEESIKLVLEDYEQKE
jgi:hypothetical protein